jgi:tRNA-uridine 2-sulfurtransferase
LLGTVRIDRPLVFQNRIPFRPDAQSLHSLQSGGQIRCIAACRKRVRACFRPLSTGHYARVAFNAAQNRHILKKGIEPKKDQSYFLYRLSQEQLFTVVFPLGGLTKQQVRVLAHDHGLSVHDKKESQDFYSGDYGELLGEENRPGDIVDKTGNVLGRHNGIWNYTIGQRKGLGIAYSEPLYVLAIDASCNRIVVGTEADTLRSTFMASDIVWSGIETLPVARGAQVKIRSAAPAAEATIEPAENGAVRVQFQAPYASITPGQSAVFYDGDVVLGGGVIEKTAD